MRFYLGETYETDFGGGTRQALVVILKAQGTEAILRFFDTQDEFSARWVELQCAGKWRRVASSD